MGIKGLGLKGLEFKGFGFKGLGFQGFRVSGLGAILGLYWGYVGIMEKKMETIGIIGYLLG